MSGVQLRRLATSRRVLLVFAVLVTGPLLLTVNSFRPLVFPPSWLLSIVETLFRLFAYLPVSAIRRLLFEPFGIAGVFAVPVVSHVFVLASLFAFYYGVSLLAVVGWELVQRRRDPTDRPR